MTQLQHTTNANDYFIATFFVVYWKRRSSALSFEWQVDTKKIQHKQRKQFWGFKRTSPITDKPEVS
jgi:hypothetical protein